MNLQTFSGDSFEAVAREKRAAKQNKPFGVLASPAFISALVDALFALKRAGFFWILFIHIHIYYLSLSLTDR
jgi:hypothetical protein